MLFKYVYGRDISRYYRNVSISIERIYPEDAIEMLKSNVGNRSLKRMPLADAIENGEWTLNGATIVFSDEGILLDGQNRLIACIKSGKPIDSIVVRGIKKPAQVTMDTGIKRQVSDNLKMQGVKDYTTVAAIGTTMAAVDYLGFQAGFYKRSNRMTTKSAVDYIMNNLDRIKFLKSVIGNSRKDFKGFPVGSMAVLYDRFYKVSEPDADCFIKQLNSPSPQYQPIAMLRDALLKNAAKKDGRFSAKYLGAITIKAWNAFMQGQEIKCLKFAQGGHSPESFPKIYGLDDEDE